MVEKKYDLRNAKIVSVSVKNSETEKEKRIADEAFRNATPEERQATAYKDAHQKKQ